MRLGKKYCGEAELLPLLLSHGIVRRVRTIDVEVQPLGGDSFKIMVDATRPRVGEVKAEIARIHGTPARLQDIYKMRNGVVREDDAEPGCLDDDEMAIEEGLVVTLAVKEETWVWNTCPEEYVELSEGGAVATQHSSNLQLTRLHLVTTGVKLRVGTHYWEVELLTEDTGNSIYVGVTRPNLNSIGWYGDERNTNGWFIVAYSGGLCGNGEDGYSRAGEYQKGDCVGVLLDLADGSLSFFKNGMKHGPGYPAGSVTGPVVHAVQMYITSTATRSVRLLPNPVAPSSELAWR
jgi:hypothetical protein